LSKAQVIYALETLFRWHGAKIILNADNTFGVASSSQSPKQRAASPLQDRRRRRVMLRVAQADV
jgi:hypothetical protein